MEARIIQVQQNERTAVAMVEIRNGSCACIARKCANLWF